MVYADPFFYSLNYDAGGGGSGALVLGTILQSDGSLLVNTVSGTVSGVAPYSYSGVVTGVIGPNGFNGNDNLLTIPNPTVPNFDYNGIGWSATPINSVASIQYNLYYCSGMAEAPQNEDSCNSNQFGRPTMVLVGNNGFQINSASISPANITSEGSPFLSSKVGVAFNPIFDGGTLRVDQSGVVASNLSVTFNNGVIDQNGRASVFSGVISDAENSVSGSLNITNGRTGGSVTFNNVNTYTGSTTIGSAATLALSGAGSIATSSGVIDNGTLDISNAASGASIQSISGTGTVALGAQSLSVTNASGSLSGAIGGTGGLNITGGIQTLSGANTYSGATSIGSGSTLALSGTGSIAASSVVTNNGTFDISAASSGATVKAISGGGSVALGNKSLTIANASGNLSGTVGGAGGLNIAGGNQTLSGNNTYSGGTEVQSGANLSIASGSALGSGTLSLVGTSTVPATLTTTATTTIANSITVSGDPVFNVASGTTTTVSSPITDGASSGDVVVAGGGTLNLTAVNTYTGLTAIGAGSTLALSGVGSITPSSSVTNNGTFNVSGKTGNVSVANYTQGSAGTLALNVTPGATSKLNVAGTASLAGSLALTSAAGPYTAGSKYTLLTANGVTGTFGNLTSNLASYTRLAYGLAYDANDVYLVFTPNVADTQQSLVNSSQALQSTYTLQNSVLANSFSYDCNEFGEHGICISAGGRNTAVSAANGLNNTSALLIAAYKVHPQVRIGAYADQNLSMNNASSTVNLGNNTPLIGLFGAWNERLDGTGTEIKVSAAYGQKSATVTRQVVNTSEPGTGSANLNSQGAQITAKYGFAVMPEVIVSPYAGIRYTQNNMGGYTEATSSTVTTPLTYSALNTNATTALAGVGASYHFIPKATVYASAGVETDTNTANGTYSATGITGLTPINFNANPVKTRPTATLGAYYDVEKNQRVGINGIYRQEPYQGVSTTSVMMTYTVGL